MSQRREDFFSLKFSFFSVLSGLLLLIACMDTSLDPDALIAKTTTPQSGPACASCHGYPLRDTNHVYHLFETDSSITNNRPITCLDCHARSMASHRVTFLDTVYQDTNGNEFHAIDFPDDPELRTFRLLRVETLIRPRPIPMPTRPGPLSEMVEWVTALAHMNGVVDVEFDSTSVDTGRFHGTRAVYRSEQQTCSSVACHPNPGAYRWAAPSHGLSLLKGDSVHLSQPIKKP